MDETLEDGNKFVTFYYDTETLYEKLDEFGKDASAALYHQAAGRPEPVSDCLRQGAGQRCRSPQPASTSRQS